MKIRDLTNELAGIRKKYQEEFQKATQKKETEMKRLNSDYIKGSKSYMAEKEEIELEYQVSVVRAQKRAAEKGGEAIDTLREQELSSISRVDETALERINALKDIPLTATELNVLFSKSGSNYWTIKAISTLAEQNGVSTSDLNLPAPIDTKLSVLNQLLAQLNDMLNDYDLTHTTEAVRARHLLLNSDILERANQIFNNEMGEVSDQNAAEVAAARIHGIPGQMSKAIAISNAMQNLQSKSARNDLLYRISSDATVSDSALMVSGYFDEVQTWRAGLNMRYGEAMKLSRDLAVKSDKQDIQNTIQTYKSHLEESGLENPFLTDVLKSVAKENTAVSDVLMEMSGIKDADNAESAE